MIDETSPSSIGKNFDKGEEKEQQPQDPWKSPSPQDSRTSPNSRSQHHFHGTPSQHYSPMMMDSTPPGMDREAYIAGERAAITRSLQMMLPSQQQLGALGSGLQRLEYMVSEEANRARQMHSATVELSTVAQNLTERLDRIEQNQLPVIENKVQHALEAPLSQEFKATLSSLTDAMRHSSRQQYIGNGPTFTGFVLQQLGWLGSAAVLYTQKALSKADIAALFLSRKILLDEKAHGSHELLAGDAGDMEGLSRRPSIGLEHKLTSVGGATLFLAAVEIAWQLHNRAMSAVPKRLRHAVYPAKLGLRVLRIATWVASILITTVIFRRGCYVLADSCVAKLKRFLLWCREFKPFSSPPAVEMPGAESDDQKKDEGLELISSTPDFSAAAAEKQKMPYSEVIRLQAESRNDSSHPIPAPLNRVRSIFDTPPPSPQ